jgi:FkbM family methyltransferase
MMRGIRIAVLRLFRRVNPGDVTIRHHWTGKPFRLHSFRHKGYWWYGRNRERETMEMFAKLIGKNDIVWEVGAHIGYLTVFFCLLSSRVTAFEPSAENLKYLSRNAPANARIVPAAATEEEAENVPLYTENLTGQNCSLLPDYREFDINAKLAGYTAQRSVEHVRAVSLDSYSVRTSEVPDFVKIDVEGAELEVLRGMTRILADRGPRLMVEMTDRENEVVALLGRFGYECTARFALNTFWEKKPSA